MIFLISVDQAIISLISVLSLTTHTSLSQLSVVVRHTNNYDLMHFRRDFSHLIELI